MSGLVITNVAVIGYWRRVEINSLVKLEMEHEKTKNKTEGDICQFAALKSHYQSRKCPAKDEGLSLFTAANRPRALSALYAAATTGPVAAVRQLDRWRRDGQRSSGFFVCTPVLQAKRRRMRQKVDIEIETRMPAAVEELRRWTSDEALGDVTVMPDCASRIPPVTTFISDNQDATDVGSGVVSSDDEGVDHKLPSPEEQLQVMALKFPAQVVAVDISGRSFDRMSAQRRSLTHADLGKQPADGDTVGSGGGTRRRRGRRPRSRRRNTLAGTDQKEIADALRADETTPNEDTDPTTSGVACRSKSGDLFRSLPSKKDILDIKKSHFDMLKQWGKSRYDKLMNKSSESKTSTDVDDFNVYETVTVKRKRDVDKERKTHERNSSISSSEKSVANVPVTTSTLSSVMNIAVKLRESSAQRRQRRAGNNKDEPHSSSGNWSASSESGRASIGSEITTHPKSSTSAATSNNSLNQQPPSSVASRRRFPVTTSGSSSMTSEGTLTPDIIHDLHEDGETSSVYSCDTEGYYTSFHMDSGLKTLKEEETPPTPLHSTSAFSNSGSNNTVLSAENEYELFGKGSTSTTTSSAGTVCTALRASESTRSLVIGPAVPERKSSLSKLSSKSPESSLERDLSSDKTGTVKRSPATSSKPTVVALVHKESNNNGDVSPDSGHNTSSSPIESISSPNGVRSGSDFEFSESSDMEGPERIERIRVKTTINSSRIPSMCVITPPHSDEESEHSSSSSKREFKKTLQPKTDTKQPIQRIISTTVNGSNQISLVNVNPQSGYATIQSIDQPDSVGEKTVKTETSRTIRAPSPSGGIVIVKEEPQNKSPVQPVIKASLLPLNNMFGKIKMNIANFAQKRDRSKSPSANKDQQTKLEEFDAGEYVTIADVRNNNGNNLKAVEDITYANDVVNKNLTTVLSGKIRDTEYVCLNELPCNENNNVVSNVNVDSLERKRQGARVKLDAEGKVVYSSDSLKRRAAHTTFEPGPNVKNTMDSPLQSPIPTHRLPKNLRPVNNNQENRPLSPQSGKLVIRACSGQTSSTSEIIRMPPSTIVTPGTRPMSPKSRGAYVRMPETAKSPVIGQDKGKLRVRTKNSLNEKNARRVRRSDSYRLANGPPTNLEALDKKLDIVHR
ncbi:unnamed protein product [Acanthoscelides obtectus]|uniref:WASP family protein member n=2 Tax=Acanthoscelides obtectus TaxID=200917 RepID=A0A9P0Q7R3_ACAOB|nr:unnamed protein product [Acanthoscelides obtectus]CAK1629291.1 hypothetical protein AOBTE_LOCUS5660 [Acanthoscelides obtectus]